jgi:hypothetical protein
LNHLMGPAAKLQYEQLYLRTVHQEGSWDLLASCKFPFSTFLSAPRFATLLFLIEFASELRQSYNISCLIVKEEQLSEVWHE